MNRIATLTQSCKEDYCGKRALEAGVEPKTIQKYLGHATIQMTMDLYVHVTDSTIHNEIEKVSASFLAINESKKVGR